MLSAIDPHFTKTFELKQHHSSLRETALDSLITSTLLPIMMGCSSRPSPSWRPRTLRAKEALPRGRGRDPV